MAEKLLFKYADAESFIPEGAIENIKEEALKAKDVLVGKSGKGNDFLGWLDLPVNYDKEEFSRIIKAAEKIKNDSDVFIVILASSSFGSMLITLSL